MPKPNRRSRSKRNAHSYVRQQKSRELRKRFLLVCEGEKTEPNYFEGFRVPREIIEIKGLGYNTLSLVREAVKLAKRAEFDQVWVVLDKDDFQVDHFNRAIVFAKQQGISVAYSNEAFELWYLLHFDYHQAAISRETYKNRLSQAQRLGFEYKKNDPSIHELLRPRIETAIQNASRLLRTYGETHSPARDNPCTTVHLLVQQLLQNEK